MKAQREADLGVRNLELLFVPPGLPFVSKVDGEVGAASFLLRGRAGTGKTTLAVALAHAAARHAKGSVLYVTTELGPADVSFKASLLGLGEAIVWRWDERGRAPAGSILVLGLPSFASSGAGSSNADRDHLALRVARELFLASADREPAQPPTGDAESAPHAPFVAPIRAVVIDALAPIASDEEARARRTELSSFVQMLEARDVSTVLVEETTAGSPDAISAAVDVVLSPSLRADPDTGELSRKLACLKSRFARALPGPHDYGADPETHRPTVWPDLLSLAVADREPPFAVPKARQARMLVPTAEDCERLVAHGGSIILSRSDRSGTCFIDALRHTPGVRIVEWRSGPLIAVLTKQKRAEIAAGSGPNALGDVVVRALRDASANTVVIHGVEVLLDQPKLRAPILRLLEALRAFGVLVCVHGKARALRRIEPIADRILDESRRNARRSIPALRYRPAAIWLLDLNRPDLLTARRGDLAVDSAEHAALIAALARYRAGASDIDPLRSVVAPAMDVITPEPHPNDLPPALRAPLAWTYALTGRDAEAARVCYEAGGSDAQGSPALLSCLWWSLNAVHAQSSAAIEALLILRGKPEGRFTLGFHLRALARCGRVDESDSVAEACREAYNLSDIMVARLKADARLDASEPAALAEAKAMLAALAAIDDLPTLHRAEIAHNLGYAHERLGEIDDAARWYRRALAVNPGLQISSQALARLGDVGAAFDVRPSAQGELPFLPRS